MLEFLIDFVTHGASALIALGLYHHYIHKHYQLSEKLPYRYICAHEDCNYHSSSTEMAWVDRDASAHERWHQEGEQGRPC